MEKQKLMIIIMLGIACTLIVGGGIGFYVWYINREDSQLDSDADSDNGSDDVEDDFVESNLFQISGKSDTKTSSGGLCEYTISYPMLSGSGDTDVHSSVNPFFKSEFVPSDEEVDTCETGNSEVTDYSYTADISYEVKLNNYPLVSICKDTNSYTGGAAHPAVYKDCYTMDVSTGDLYSLDDLLSEGYADDLGTKVESLLDESLGEGWLFDGFPGIDDGHNYYLTDENLVVFYDSYTVAPGAAGIPEAPVPYSDPAVSNYVDSGSPISGF